jgi:thiamine kinase-like enzyme
MERSLNEVALRFTASIQRYADWVESDFPPGQTAAMLCQEIMEQRLDLLPTLVNQTPPLCFCRSDPRFANVIRRPDGRLGMIDWEDSGLRDPARDLADLITHPNQEDLVSQAQWQALLQPYIAAHARRDPDLAHRVHLYLALFPLFWTTIIMDRELGRLQRGESGEWMVNELPATVRLQRYLARGLAWPNVEFENMLNETADLVFFPS